MFKKKPTAPRIQQAQTLSAKELEKVDGGYGGSWTIHRVNTCSFDNPYGQDWAGYGNSFSDGY